MSSFWKAGGSGTIGPYCGTDHSPPDDEARGGGGKSSTCGEENDTHQAWSSGEGGPVTPLWAADGIPQSDWLVLSSLVSPSLGLDGLDCHCC